jgi:uncharacterized protein
MKRYLLLLVSLLGLCMMSVNATALSINADKQQQVQKLLKVMHFDQTQAALLKKLNGVVAAYLERSHSDLLPGSLGVVKKTVHKEIAQLFQQSPLRPTVARIYAKTFTQQELQAMIRFYSTAVGQRILKKLPAAMQQATDIYMQQVSVALPSINAKIATVLQQQGYGSLDENKNKQPNT